jgi:hypothetical protein
VGHPHRPAGDGAFPPHPAQRRGLTSPPPHPFHVKIALIAFFDVIFNGQNPKRFREIKIRIIFIKEIKYFSRTAFQQTLFFKRNNTNSVDSWTYGHGLAIFNLLQRK